MVTIVLDKNGFDVKSTSNSHDAIDVAYQWNPNLILPDIRMSIKNKFTITACIREFASTPIIMLSGTEEKADLDRGFEAGANDYILKPFSSQELIDRVGTILQRFDLGSVTRNESNGRE
jgi:DNA-binding response OmpR family regulator